MNEEGKLKWNEEIYNGVLIKEALNIIIKDWKKSGAHLTQA